MMLWQMETPNYWLIALTLFVVFLMGITFFSYLNFVIERLPQKKSVIGGEMTCPHCQHTKTIKDSIPIFSYARMGGKCPYCFEKTSVREPLIEVLGGVLAVGIVSWYGITFASLTLFLLYSVLTAIAIIDYDTMEIPFVLNCIIFLLGVASYFTMDGPGLLSRGIGMICVSGVLFIIVLIIPGGFGGGDIKMMFAIGAFLGWKGTVMGFFIGLLLGGAYGVYVLATKKKGRKEHFAFGPFLAVGIAIAAFDGLGEYLLDCYLQTFIF